MWNESSLEVPLGETHMKVFIPCHSAFTAKKIFGFALFSAAVWCCQLPGKREFQVACAGAQTYADELFKLEKRNYEGDAE